MLGGFGREHGWVWVKMEVGLGECWDGFGSHCMLKKWYSRV